MVNLPAILTTLFAKGLLPLAAQRTYQETLNSSPCSPDREAGQRSQGSERALFRAEGAEGETEASGRSFSPKTREFRLSLSIRLGQASWDLL